MFKSKEELISTINNYLKSYKALPSGIELGNEIIQLLNSTEYSSYNIRELERVVAYKKWELRDKAYDIKKLMACETDPRNKKQMLIKYRDLRRQARKFDLIRKVLKDDRYFREAKEYEQ